MLKSKGNAERALTFLSDKALEVTFSVCTAACLIFFLFSRSLRLIYAVAIWCALIFPLIFILFLWSVVGQRKVPELTFASAV